MVLWEITLGTAYFLGLKRTYRLALRIQRRLLPAPPNPNNNNNNNSIRNFLQRRTRAVFDVALKVHQNIQQRDIEVGRNLGSRILQWLDRIKPSAQIRGPPELKPPEGSSLNMSKPKQAATSSHVKTPPGKILTPRNRESVRHLFTSSRHLFASSRNIWPKPFPTIAMMMRPSRPVGFSITQYRHSSLWTPEMVRSIYGVGIYGLEGVVPRT